MGKIKALSDRFVKWFSWYVRSLTIEPMHFLYCFGTALVSGAQLNTNLQMEKVCKYEYGYNDTVCDNLQDYEDEQIEVQKRVNDFQEVSSWLGQAPGIAYSLVAGPISDHVGLKPLLILPISGAVISSVFMLINYIYLETLPLEFYYTINFYQYLGGSAVYYLGYYTYGTAITDQEGRASRLARYDGFEVMAFMAGLLLSPVVFEGIDYLGTFSLQIVIMTGSFLYLVLVVREPERAKPERKVSSKKKLEALAAGEKPSRYARLQDFFYFSIVEPLYKVAQAMLKRRPRNLRLLMWVQLLVYATYWFLVNETSPLYLYQTLVFEDFDGTSSSYYTSYDKFTSMIGLFVVLPVLSERLHIHDALTLTVIQFFYCAGNTVMALAKELWQMYLGQTILFMRMCEWSTARALLTKTIPSEEVGTVFTVIALFAATVPLASNPAFRELYDATIETYPSAFLLLGAAIGLALAAANFFVFTQRRKLLVDRMGREINEGTGGGGKAEEAAKEEEVERVKE